MSEKLISSFYKLENLNSPEFLTVDKKYYLAEMTESKTLKKNKNEKEVIDYIKAQIIMKTKSQKIVN